MSPTLCQGSLDVILLYELLGLISFEFAWKWTTQVHFLSSFDYYGFLNLKKDVYSPAHRSGVGCRYIYSEWTHTHMFNSLSSDNWYTLREYYWLGLMANIWHWENIIQWVWRRACTMHLLYALTDRADAVLFTNLGIWWLCNE